MARPATSCPILILLDIAMPKIDGWHECANGSGRTRARPGPVCGDALSGKDAFFDKVKGHMAGASEYLTKPFETAAVLAVVTSYCKRPSEAVHG